jgi:hypothetical protein
MPSPDTSDPTDTSPSTEVASQASVQMQPPQHNTTSSSATTCPKQKLFMGLIALIGLALTVAMVGAGVMAYRNQQQAQVVKSVAPAARVLSVSLHGGLWSRSPVQTDRGYFSVADGVSLFKGQILLIEELANAERYRSDEQHRCTELL